MATNITKITPEELVGKGVVGMDDAPELSTLEMQERLDQLSLEVIIPHINGMADEIDAAVDGVDFKITNEKARAMAAEGELSLAVATKMTTATYDSDADGIVDNSEALNGHSADYFATAQGLSNEVTRAQNAEAALSREITEKLDVLGLSVVNGELCMTYNT